MKMILAAAALGATLSFPAVAQVQAPAGTVTATATIAPERGQPSQHSGFVRRADCGRALPAFWRPDTGWVRTSYRCGR
jgi:hypothetical protein